MARGTELWIQTNEKKTQECTRSAAGISVEAIELLGIANLGFALQQIATVIDEMRLGHGQELFPKKINKPYTTYLLVFINDAMGKAQGIEVLQHILHE